MTQRPPQHAHAVMHCNLNTLDLESAEAFYLVVAGRPPRFRSLGQDQDATAMGLGTSTSSVTAFVWDERGPRAAPALEVVAWEDPPTEVAGYEQRAGFSAIGYRVPDLDAARHVLSGLRPLTDAELVVRGSVRPAVVLTDPDGVLVEVVEVPFSDAGDPGADAPALSHERLRVTDLERSLRWYASIGFETLHRDGGRASIVLPEDPTFSLELEERPDVGPSPSRANRQGLFRLALAVEDVELAARALRAADPATSSPVFIPMEDTPTGGYTVLFLTDPDGTVVELVTRPRTEVRRPLAPV